MTTDTRVSDDITLLCEHCGHTQSYNRGADPYLPAEVVKIVTNECDKCEAANGGFGGERWLDANGDEVEQS